MTVFSQAPVGSSLASMLRVRAKASRCRTLLWLPGEGTTDRQKFADAFCLLTESNPRFPVDPWLCWIGLSLNTLADARDLGGSRSAAAPLARLQSMDEIIKDWIVEILEQHKDLLAIAVRQRAKFEGWLKFELSALAEKHGAQSVEVEAASSNSTSQRFDLAFLFNGIRYNVELKTPNSNWRMSGVRNRHRPITKNVDGIVRDARKLYNCLGQGVVAFILFPIPPHDNRWTKYLDRIASELQISLSEQKHCRRLSLALGNEQSADLLVCSFIVPQH